MDKQQRVRTMMNKGSENIGVTLPWLTDTSCMRRKDMRTLEQRDGTTHKNREEYYLAVSKEATQ